MAEELSLDALREEIDGIDEVIVRLLDRRARCAYAVGRVKHATGGQIYEPQREAAVMTHVRAVNAGLGGPLTEDAITRLYERVMDEARRIQRMEAERALAETRTQAVARGAAVEDVEPAQHTRMRKD